MKKLILLTLSVVLLAGCSADNQYDIGYKEGYSDGLYEGQNSGIEQSYDEGYSDGHYDGYDEGYSDGLYDGYDEGYDDGYSDGDSYDDGYVDGYVDVVYFFESPQRFDPAVIPMIPVTSSFINSVGYSPRYEVLLISMNEADLYAYYDVSSLTFYSLIHADSLGEYFNTYIKPKYEYEKLY